MTEKGARVVTQCGTEFTRWPRPRIPSQEEKKEEWWEGKRKEKNIKNISNINVFKNLTCMLYGWFVTYVTYLNKATFKMKKKWK